MGQCQLRHFHLPGVLRCTQRWADCDESVALQLTVESGFGVHISFVRSITMDKWSDEQLKKMKVRMAKVSLKEMVLTCSSAGMRSSSHSWIATDRKEDTRKEWECRKSTTPGQPPSIVKR